MKCAVIILVALFRSAYFQDLEDDVGGGKRKGTLLGYFTSLSCPVCEERTQSGLCVACKTDSQRVAIIIGQRVHHAQRAHSQLSQVNVKILNIIAVKVSKMTSHCAGTVQMREESQSGIRK